VWVEPPSIDNNTNPPSTLHFMPANQTEKNPRGRELNPDPITGEPGAHPVGAGVGAAAGGATGAAIGSFGGPIGTAVGAVIGAVAGGLAGKGVAEMIDPTAEDAYWRESHWSQPFADRNLPYEAYAPAYRAGYAGYRAGKSFEDREADLRMEYEGGPQKAEAEAALTGNDPATTPGTMQNNLSTFPVRGDESGIGRDPAEKEGTMAHHSSTYPLRWDDAREAARAAYERVRRGKAHREVAED
jgi:uncharacterized protein YcfJ